MARSSTALVICFSRSFTSSGFRPSFSHCSISSSLIGFEGFSRLMSFSLIIAGERLHSFQDTLLPSQLIRPLPQVVDHCPFVAIVPESSQALLEHVGFEHPRFNWKSRFSTPRCLGTRFFQRL